jgi:ABC-type transport system involved in multi-copper enzyme maturation permease subunit
MIARPVRQAPARRPRLPMAWIIWRQHGAAVACALVLLAGAAAALIASSPRLHTVAADVGPKAWRDILRYGYGPHYPDVAMQAIPMLIGLFVGVPLVGRDIENGTASFAWTQGVGRVSWLLGKLIPVAALLGTAAAGFGLLFGWWFGVYLPAIGHWGMSAFPLFAPAFTGWMLAGLTLGMAAGAILHGTTRAMAITVAGWIFLHRITPFAGPQPAGRFWTFQFLELGWLVAVALLLTGVTIAIISRPPAPAILTGLLRSAASLRDLIPAGLLRWLASYRAGSLRPPARAGVSTLGVTWRQHRRALLIGLALLGGTALVLLITGLRIHAERPPKWPDLFEASGVYQPGQGKQNGNLVIPLMFPFFIGAFLGGPLVAREIERGTARFAWTQGVSRSRWVTAKLIRLGLMLAAGAVAFGLVFQWWYGPFAADRLGDPMFGLYAPVFAGWTLASFALAAFLGTALRSATPAIVLTIVGAVIAAVVNAFLRMYWLPSITGPVSDTQDGSPVFKLFYAWPDGRPVDAARMRQLHQLAAAAHIKAGLPQIHFFAHYHVIWSAVYLPGSRFWPLQLIEASGLLTATLLFAAATVWLVRRRSV